MNRFLLCTVLIATSAAALAAPQSQPRPHDIDKVNGGIVAEAGQAYGELSTVNGGIQLQRGARAGDVETVNGGIRAEDEVATHDISAVNGGIRFGRKADIAGSIETVNGEIFTDRDTRIGGDVSTVNGGIGLVGTRVAGNIETVHGDITVGAGSHVRGSIRVEKPQGNLGWMLGNKKTPRIVIGPDAVVEGPLVFEREVKLYVHASARVGSISGARAIRYASNTPPQD